MNRCFLIRGPTLSGLDQANPRAAPERAIPAHTADMPRPDVLKRTREERGSSA